MYRWTPPLRTPNPEPGGLHLETSFWSHCSNQRWSLWSPRPGRPDYTGAQKRIKGLDLQYYCVCACGKLQQWSPHVFIMKDSAGCAALITSRSAFVIIFSLSGKITFIPNNVEQGTEATESAACTAAIEGSDHKMLGEGHMGILHL